MFFKLKLELATPFYLSSRLTLDGLLSAAVHNQTGKKGDETIPHIPLERDQGIFKGSALFCHPNFRYERFSRVMALRSERDLNPTLFKPNKRGGLYGPVDQKRDAYKANMDSYAGISAKEVYFWGVGDAEQCVFLLEHFVSGIGKRANSGAGQIIGVSAHPIEQDFSWVTARGKPARPLPVNIWEALGMPAAQVSKLPVSLPYWETEPVEAVFPMEWVV